VEGRVKHPAFGLVDYAKGDVFRRNNVVALKDALNPRSNGGAVNSYITAYRFPEAYRDHCRTTGSVSDYAGPAYADFLHWDADCKGNLHAALLAARGLVTYLQDRFDVRPDQLRYFFSGAKGVHILLPTALLGEVEPSPLIPAVWKSMALAIAGAADVKVDKVVYDVNRLFRLPDTQHKESRLWKVELTWEELFHLGTEEIRAIAKAPRGNLFRPHDLEPIDALVEFYAKHAEAAEVEAARPRTGPLRSGAGGTAELAAALSGAYVDGQKHNLALAFAGYAAKCHLPRETAHGVFDALLESHDDPDNVHTAIDDTYDRVRQGVQVKGYTDLQVMLPAEELAQLRTLLGDVPKQSSESGRKRTADHSGPDFPAAEASAGDEAEHEEGLRDRSHDGLALELGDLWHADARHVAAWGMWLFNDGNIWRLDEQLQHMTRTRAFLRAKADEAVQTAEQMAARDKANADKIREKAAGTAKTLRAAQTVAQVVGLARSNRAQAATVSQWDADPMLLGTPAGTLDLRTGALRPARGDDHITKSVAVAPAAEGTASPLWSAFLARVTNGDAALQEYLQRLAGYFLTGSVQEHVLPFAHGGGGNGKSVFVNALHRIWGDYATVIPTEMLMVTPNDRHPTELARLRGVRLAIGSETEQGTRWAEAKIKSLTGGDPVTARFMRQDFFEFQPQFKLFVIGNHKPTLRGVDAAMRRRMHLVPFTVTIPERERDTRLPEKLRAEHPAILRWAIDGALRWQHDGLRPPELVRGATEEYLEAEDAVSLWLDERTEVDPNKWEAAGVLFASWKDWAEKAGEFVGSQKRLSQTLQDHGLVPHRMHGGIRGFYGCRVSSLAGAERWEP
jgi:P4 family phage/plasmid primase-like protien